MILIIVILIALPLAESFKGVPRKEINTKDWKNALSGALWSYYKKLESKPQRLTSLEIPKTISIKQSPKGKLTSFSTNVRVSEDLDYFYENEPSIAANPNDPKNLVVGTHQYSSITLYPAAYVSFDAGDTWKGPILLPLATPGDFGSDPSLTTDRNGTFYYSYMSIGTREIPDIRGYPIVLFSNDIVVARSLNKGLEWETTIAVTPSYLNFTALQAQGILIRELFFDKPYIGSGPNINNLDKDVIIVTFTEFLGGYNYITRQYFENITIKAVISVDGGLTWSDPIPVSPTYNYPTDFRVVQGSIPAVGPDGVIYVAYYDSGEDGWLTGKAYIMVSRSTDGGKSFEEPVIAATIPYEMSYYSGFIGFRWWSSMFPSMAIGPNGTIYIAYAADPDGLGRDLGDIFLVKSTDGGLTWSAPVRVNDDETFNAQFFPWLDVDPNGVIHVIWGDRRLDPNDFGYDVFYANSTDGGESFSENLRVTDYTNNPMLGMLYFIGDYFNVVATGENVHVVWTDSRRGIRNIGGFYWLGMDESIYTAKFGPRPKPEMILSPSDIQAGQIPIISITGSNFPREAVFSLYVDSVRLTDLIGVFSDYAGNLNLNITLPASSEGIHRIIIADWATGIAYASASLKIVDYASQMITGKLEAVNKSLSGNLSESVNVISSALEDRFKQLSTEISGFAGDVKTSITDLQSNLNIASNQIQGNISQLSQEVAEGFNSLRTDIKLRLEELSLTIGTLSRTVEDSFKRVIINISTVQDGINSLQNQLSEAKDALMDRLTTISDKLGTQTRVLLDAIGTSINRGEINIILTIIFSATIISLLFIIIRRKSI